MLRVDEDQGKTVPASRATESTEGQWLRRLAFTWMETMIALTVRLSPRSAIRRIGYSYRHDYPTDML